MQTRFEIMQGFYRQYGWPPDEDYISYELAVQSLEDQGCSRSDAQGIVDAEKLTIRKG